LNFTSLILYCIRNTAHQEDIFVVSSGKFKYFLSEFKYLMTQVISE
jgi:hypothetical protein